MHQLMYVSAATKQLADTDLEAILATSRRRNPAAEITGMLLYLDGNFLQILEGPEPAVRATFARIGEDPRHHFARVLIDRPIQERLFPAWTMGFERLLAGSGDTGDIFTATKDAIETAVSTEKAVEIAILLRTFYRVNSHRYAA